jgi:DNA-binding MarR family transcriptional regulator
LLRGAWVGYQLRLDNAMADAGFGDRGFPDGRVLRMCRDNEATISKIGRELGITRQGASKVVGSLRERGYVAVDPSPHSAREKTITLTPRALDYLAAQRKAVRTIERQLRNALGPDGFAALSRLLDELGADDQVRLRDYLKRKGVREL